MVLNFLRKNFFVGKVKFDYFRDRCGFFFALKTTLPKSQRLVPLLAALLRLLHVLWHSKINNLRQFMLIDSFQLYVGYVLFC